MQTFVRTFADNTIAINVEPRDTIAEVKAYIQDKEGVPPNQQRLAFSGKEMEDDRPLSFYEVGRESTIYLSLRICGGSGKGGKQVGTKVNKNKGKAKKGKDDGTTEDAKMEEGSGKSRKSSGSKSRSKSDSLSGYTEDEPMPGLKKKTAPLVKEYLPKQVALSLLADFQDKCKFPTVEKAMDHVSKNKKGFEVKDCQDKDSSLFTLQQVEAMLRAAPKKKAKGTKGKKVSNNSSLGMQLYYFGDDHIRHIKKEDRAAMLRPGDIMIKKLYEGFDLISDMTSIKTAQKLVQCDRGSRFTVHTAIVLNEKTIAEASGPRNEVCISKIDETNGQWAVFRCQNKKEGKQAAEIARWIAGQTDKDKKIPYSAKHCIGAKFHTQTFGSAAKKRADAIALAFGMGKGRPDPKEYLAKHNMGKMMCSEFTSLCFQGTPNKPYFDLDAKGMTPPTLESWLIKHPTKFQLVGSIINQSALHQAFEGFDRLKNDKSKLVKVEKMLASIGGRGMEIAEMHIFYEFMKGRGHEEVAEQYKKKCFKKTKVVVAIKNNGNDTQ